MSDGLWGMLVGNKNRSQNIFFQFVAAFLTWCIGMSWRLIATTLHTLYSGLWQMVYVGSRKFSQTKSGLKYLNCKTIHLKKVVVDTIAKDCCILLFTLKSRLFDHIVEDFCMFGTLSVSDSSPFENCNVHIKTLHFETPKSMKSRMEETAKGLLLCGEVDYINGTATLPVTSIARWNIPNPYCPLLVKENLLVRDSEKLSLL